METEKIIVKFLNREADINELEELDNRLKDEGNLRLFNRYVKVEFITNIGMAEYDVDKAKKAIRHRLKNNERRKRTNTYLRMAVAASITLIVGILFFKWDGNKGNHDRKDVAEPTAPILIEAGSDKAVLTLGNGNQVALEKGKEYETGGVKSDGSGLVYNSAPQVEDQKKKPVYNYLTIPRGGQFFVQLSDGTKVWLNSDSKLKYPVEFRSGQTREVELVYGEAYFEVSPSTAHNGAEFHVLTKFQEVGVLGTEFNVKAYNEEDEIATTLVEGKIKIQKNGISKILRPNQQSIIKKDTDHIDVGQVDVSQEIAWTKGLFTFNEESLEEIMTTLARWYDVEIIFENAEQKEFVFTGIIERAESVDYILELIEATSTSQVKFKIDGKTITVN